MTVCKVLLFGLKPCDISASTNEKISETSVQRQYSLIPTTSSKSQLEKSSSSSSNIDYLNLDIKPLVAAASSRSSTSNNTGHESSPIRIMIRETSQGRHRISVSQTLLRTHTGDV